MDGTTVISIGFACTVLGSLIGYLGYKRNITNDTKNDAMQHANVTARLDYISKGIEDIKVDIKMQDKKYERVVERVTRVEESAKQAHKRIDNLQKEGM